LAKKGGNRLAVPLENGNFSAGSQRCTTSVIPSSNPPAIIGFLVIEHDLGKIFPRAVIIWFTRRLAEN
jgi:hypothetical protein